MAYVVGDPCIKCKYTDCVAVCPVDCIFEGKNMVMINPDECIDCGACESECPSAAIFPEEELPANQLIYKDINAVFTGAKYLDDVDRSKWPTHLRVLNNNSDYLWWPITSQKAPLPGADAAAKETNKINFLDPNRAE